MRQLLRSSGVPCARRGYHEIGADMVRASSKSTVRASSVTVTSIALAIEILSSIREELIPVLQEAFFVFNYKPPNPIDFIPAETSGFSSCNLDRIEPNLNFALAIPNMYMRPFPAVTSVKVKTIGAVSEHRGHRLAAPTFLCLYPFAIERSLRLSPQARRRLRGLA